MIYISAGHNLGSPTTKADPGAIGNGFQEADLTIQQRNLTIRALQDLGGEVKSDTDTETLSQYLSRLKKVVSSKDICVEYHFDAGPLAATGCTTIVGDNASQVSKDLAKALVDETARILGIKNRGMISESQSARGKLGFMRLAARTVIVEVGFITNLYDLSAWLEYRKELAAAHAQIIHQYVQKSGQNYSQIKS